MSFVLRFVQHYKVADRAAFLAVEAEFAAMEKRRPELPQGLRMQTYAGREAANALIWECTFPDLAAAQADLAKLSGDPEHKRLLARQSPYMTDAYTEIYEVLDLASKGGK